jgi:hypothetical protein
VISTAATTYPLSEMDGWLRRSMDKGGTHALLVGERRWNCVHFSQCALCTTGRRQKAVTGEAARTHTLMRRTVESVVRKGNPPAQSVSWKFLVTEPLSTGTDMLQQKTRHDRRGLFIFPIFCPPPRRHRYDMRDARVRRASRCTFHGIALGFAAHACHLLQIILASAFHGRHHCVGSIARSDLEPGLICSQNFQYHVKCRWFVVRYLKYERRKRELMISISGEYETQDLDWFGPFRE